MPEYLKSRNKITTLHKKAIALWKKGKKVYFILMTKTLIKCHEFF